MRLISALLSRLHRIDSIESRCERIQEALGRIEARQLHAISVPSTQDAEFRVFSQWGEDGIIQWLVGLVPIARRVFVEFGVQDYLEANTRFLLVHHNWSGLVMDGDEPCINRIRSSELYWRYNLKAQSAFVTRENINELLLAAGISGDIGLLSIDIDGNDYWVWEAIETVSPRIVVSEYNARFGIERAVTVPYDASFVRSRAHPSMIYYGASLLALERLGARKGYALVGCNSAGNNAFFVRRDCLPEELRVLTAGEAFVPSQFRESRDQQNQLQFMSPEQERSVLEALPLVNVEG